MLVSELFLMTECRSFARIIYLTSIERGQGHDILGYQTSGDTLALRPSMIKFTGSDATDIEICGQHIVLSLSS
jgi:hypothetical protein